MSRAAVHPLIVTLPLGLEKAVEQMLFLCLGGREPGEKAGLSLRGWTRGLYGQRNSAGTNVKFFSEAAPPQRPAWIHAQGMLKTLLRIQVT